MFEVILKLITAYKTLSKLDRTTQILLNKLANNATFKEFLKILNTTKNIDIVAQNKILNVIKTAQPETLKEFNRLMGEMHTLINKITNLKVGNFANASDIRFGTSISSWVLSAWWEAGVESKGGSEYGILKWNTKLKPNKIYETPNISQTTWKKLTEKSKEGHFGTGLWEFNLLQKGGLNVSKMKKTYAKRTQTWKKVNGTMKRVGA